MDGSGWAALALITAGAYTQSEISRTGASSGHLEWASRVGIKLLAVRIVQKSVPCSGDASGAVADMVPAHRSLLDRRVLDAETNADTEDHLLLDRDARGSGRAAVPGHPLLPRRGRTADPGDAVHLRLQPGGVGGDVRRPVLGLPGALGPTTAGGTG